MVDKARTVPTKYIEFKFLVINVLPNVACFTRERFVSSSDKNPLLPGIYHHGFIGHAILACPWPLSKIAANLLLL
jgi:hypothetical protein